MGLLILPLSDVGNGVTRGDPGEPAERGGVHTAGLVTRPPAGYYLAPPQPSPVGQSWEAAELVS